MSKLEVIEAKQKVEAELAGLRDVAGELSDRAIVTRQVIEENAIVAVFAIGVIGLALLIGSLIGKKIQMH